MFETVFDLEDTVNLLELERILFERKEGHAGRFLDGEEFYVYAQDALTELAAEVVYLEITDSTLYKFCFPELHNFYTLCKEHSKRNHISFRKDPYVKAAEEYVADAFRCTESPNFAWNLWVPPKLVKKRAYTVIVETGMYFMEYAEMIETLYDIKEHYAGLITALKKELSDRSNIIPLPVAVGKERKAA